MRRSILAAGSLACGLVLILAASASAGPSARAGLNTRIPDAKLTNVTLDSAIDFLRDVGGANIDVDWKSLEAVNVNKDTQVNLSLHDVSVGKILSLVLSEAADGDLLTYYVDNNVVEVTTRQVEDQKMITVVYYVADILGANTPFNGRITGGGTNFSSSGNGGGGGSSGSSVIGNSSSNTGTNTQTAAQQADALIKLIETVVHPEVWRDNGGTAAMAYINGNLVVSAPRSVQEAIGGPLN